MLNDKEMLGIWTYDTVKEQILRSLDHLAAEAEKKKPVKRTHE